MASRDDLNEALERYHRTALRVLDDARAEGVRAERARVRRELLASVSGLEKIARDASDDTREWSRGSLDSFDAVLTALDRICPEEG